MTDTGLLSPAKQALLAQRLLQRRLAAAADTIRPREPGVWVPLSSTQRRMWFLAQWSPGSYTFNAARAVSLRGALDRPALQRALTAVVERHEVLRTVVAPEPEPHQLVLQEWSLLLEVVPGEGELDEQLSALAREPFDLTAEIPIRATLVELGPEDYVLLLRLHHIAGDAHSGAVLFQEISELYRAERERRPASLPDLPVQYADYTLWQQSRLQGPFLDRLVAYWSSQLDGAPARLAMPTDRPRPPVQRHIGAHRRLSFEHRLGERLNELGRAHGATFFMTALAGFATLLHRRSGDADIVIGSPIANRNQVELEHLVGFFSNTLALRLELGGNPSFAEVLSRTRRTAVEAYAHQDLPFDTVVEVAAPRRDPSYNPLFQVNFRAQDGERPRLALAGLETELLHVDIGFSRFDLALEMELRDDALVGYFEYDCDLFEPATIDGLIEDLELLLEQVADDPESPVLAIKLPRRESARPSGRIARRRPG